MAAHSKKHEKKNKKTKVFLEFNEKARIDYLRGFQKRKTERQLVAREKKDKMIMEERKVLRQQIHQLKRVPASNLEELRVPEIERLVEPEVFDLPEHTVTIADIGQVDFVGKTGMRMGRNMGQDSSDSEDDKNKEDEGSESGKPEIEGQDLAKETVVDPKSLIRKLGKCTNQLSAQKLKNQKDNHRRKVQARMQSKQVKRKKNKNHKPKKR